MGRCRGGSRVAGGLKELYDYLQDYYGTLAEIATLSEVGKGIRPQIPVPEKPEALILLEKCKALGLPLVPGGLVDQPHLWIEEVRVIQEVQLLFEAMQRANNANRQ